MPLDAGQKPPQQAQMNFAPVLPLQKLQDNPSKAYEYSSIHSKIREMGQEIDNRDLQARRQVAEVGRVMSNLRSGKQTAMRDPLTYQWALVTPQLPKRARSDRHVYPIAQVNSSQLTSIWTLSRPKAVPRHFGNTNKAQIQHALIENVISYYDVQLFDELFHQQQSLSMMDFGTSAIRVFYDNKLNAIHSLQPIVQNVNKTIFDGYAYCPNCGNEGTPDDFSKSQTPQCQECGSYNIPNIIPAQQMDVAQIVGHQQISQGDIGADLMPIPALNWDMRKMIHDSSYINFKSEVPSRLVETVLGIEVAASDGDMDYGLQIINSLGTRGGSVEGLGRENLWGNHTMTSRTTIMDEDWFMPEWYAGCYSLKDEETVSGQKIPAKVPYEKIWPQGMAVVSFNDRNAVAGIYDEKPRIIGGVYHIQSFSGVGKGTSDAIEISEHLNITHSAALAAIKRFGAGGGYLYDSDVLTKAEALRSMTPKGVVGVSMKGTNYSSVDQAMTQVRHNELNESNLTMIAQLTNLLNISFQTTEFTAGTVSNKVDVNTLGGQQMLEAQNQQRSAAPLRMKGYSLARVFENVLELFREHIQIAKFFGMSDKFSLQKGRMISGKDLPEHIKCDFVPDSEQPTNSYTKMDRINRMAEQSVNFSGVPFAQFIQMNPRLASWYADQHGAEIPVLNYQSMLIVCQERIDELQELCQEAELIAQVSGFQDPQAAEKLVDELSPPLTMNEENLATKAEIIGSYLDDDEVKQWSPLMSAAVAALIQRHLALAAADQTRKQGLIQDGQLQLAAKANAAQNQMQAPVMAQQNQTAMMQAGAEKLADQVVKEDDFHRDQKGKDLDEQRAEAKAQADHERNKEIAKLRPKPGQKK